MTALRRIAGPALVAAALLLGGPVRALSLPESAMLAAEDSAPRASVAIPVGGFDGKRVPTITAEGTVTRRAWQEPLKDRTTLQVFAPLRDQITAEGFAKILDCAAETCGGFDFRYATDTLPEPAMHVDLGDFRFLSARRLGTAGPEYVTLMVSRSSERAFVQLTRVVPAAAAAPDRVSASKSNRLDDLPGGETTLADRLVREGRAVLEDLDFATGAAALAEEEFASLVVLARFLEDNPGVSVMLVGHTDAVGTLDSNIALSRRRAEAVRDYLVRKLGVAANRISAEGAGFLAPLASNGSEEGRMRNRRVEVILTATD